MNRSKIAIRNSLVGLFSQIVAVLFQFITRSVFVRYLGVELLGISSTFTSVLNTLSLAELGFHSAIVYSLYKPLETGNHEKVNTIINVLKIIYRAIGCFFIIAGFICTLLLSHILTGVEINSTVYLIFYIQVANSACSYFLAYKRSLLYADKREFLTKIVDTVMNVLINLIKIFIVVKTSNYIIYISLTTIQTILSNLVIHVLSWKIYPFLHRVKFDYAQFKSIWGNVKNLFVGKIAFYIYTSTPSLVVSTFVNTISVGFMVNYTTITSSIKTLSNSIMNPITPIIGGMLASENDVDKNESLFKTYTFIRYIFACIVIIPIIVLMQSFISVWVGEQYLLSNMVVLLYGIDLFIHIVHSSLCDFINGRGLFRYDRNVEIIGAVCNIATSIILARIIGLEGVLFATVFSQMIFWVGRSYIAYKYCFGSNKNSFIKYWLKVISYIFVFGCLIFISTMIYKRIIFSPYIVRFIVGGLICEAITVIVLFGIYSRSHEFKQMLLIVSHVISKNASKNK